MGNLIPRRGHRPTMNSHRVYMPIDGLYATSFMTFKSLCHGSHIDAPNKGSYYWSSHRKDRVIKCKRTCTQRGVMVPGIPCIDCGNGGWDSTSFCIVCSHLLPGCVVKKVVARITTYSFISHTRALIAFGMGQTKNYFWKVSQVSKVPAWLALGR